MSSNHDLILSRRALIWRRRAPMLILAGLQVTFVTIAWLFVARVQPDLTQRYANADMALGTLTQLALKPAPVVVGCAIGTGLVFIQLLWQGRQRRRRLRDAAIGVGLSATVLTVGIYVAASPLVH